ncbi:MAG: MFS transporter [Actinocatenispora sp.]
MRHFRLLVVGNGVSAYGSYLNMVALNVFVYQATGSALAAGLFMAARLATSVASGFVSGRLVSRYDRKRLMVGADLTQATVLAALLLAPGTARVGLVFVLAVAAGACSTLHQVALRTSVPEIVGAEHRARANGLLVTGRSLAMIAGFASAGVIISEFGYPTAFALDAGTFVISALVLFLLPIRTRAVPAPADAGSGAAEGQQTRSAARWATVALLRSTPLVAVMVAIRSVDALGSSSHNVALPVYSSILDPSHPAAFISQFWATWAIGNIVAQQWCGRITRKAGRTLGERTFALGACVMSAAFILVFTGMPTVPAILAALIAGMADGVTEIAYVSRLQTAPDEQRGRLFGFSASAENTGFGLGMIVSAALLDSFSPIQVVGSFHGLAIVLCLGFLVVLIRPVRRAPVVAPDLGDPRPGAEAPPGAAQPSAKTPPGADAPVPGAGDPAPGAGVAIVEGSSS